MSTGNTERMRAELQKAVGLLTEKYPGYRQVLVQAALECVTDTAEHDDKRVNINQRFDGQVARIAEKLVASKEVRNP